MLELKEAVLQLGFTGAVSDQSPIAGTDLFLSSECFQAFFKVLQPLDKLEPEWERCQQLIAEYRSSHVKLPRDLYLTFVVPEDNESVGPQSVARVIGDSLFCRKFVVLTNGNVGDSLQQLPFLGFRKRANMRWIALDNIVEALKAQGYPAYLIEMFGRYKESAGSIVSIIADKEPPPLLSG